MQQYTLFYLYSIHRDSTDKHENGTLFYCHYLDSFLCCIFLMKLEYVFVFYLIINILHIVDEMVFTCMLWKIWYNGMNDLIYVSLQTFGENILLV